MVIIAAGLCAHVRACAGAAESLHTYTHTCPIIINARKQEQIYMYTHCLSSCKL